MAEANRDQPQDNAIVFRIGLHLGDLIVDGDDLYGDGVNVAARLEAGAPPGGIVISGDVHNAVAGRLKAAFVALGKLLLKNIERPVRAFSDTGPVPRSGWPQAHPPACTIHRCLPD
jgi:adenylate cyclase